jgi:class 3 adenylate cyclase/tetratricopeptide (TPR) repeat protein
VTEIGLWLEKRGLEQYADWFARRNVDLARLLGMTEGELADLGLASHSRQAILREIAAETRHPAGHVLSDTAERRQLTIMFCDLVNSVGLSSGLDPEDLRDLISAYHGACTQAVALYNGYVARYLGDGLLIYFGYPAAHEDDVERAIRAGLELIDALAKLNERLNRAPDAELKVRVGVATGTVVVGDVVREGISDRDTVVGEAVNLAARLQEAALPNTLVVSQSTRDLAGEWFEYHDLGARKLKGFARPVALFQVTGQRNITRLAARRAAFTPFVGRRNEIETLMTCWERAAAGEGQVILLSGEAGIGKSRIVAEAAARIQRRDPAVPAPFVLQYSPYHSNEPLYPTIKQIEQLAGIGPSDPPAVKRAKLRRHFPEDDLGQQRNSPLIAELLGIEAEAAHPPLNLSPTTKRHLTIEMLADWYAAFGADYPVTIVFEDVQWIDPTSKLLLRRLANWARHAKALIAITWRSDSGHHADGFLKDAGLAGDHGDASNVTVCEVPELDAAAAMELATTAASAEGETIDDMQLRAVLSRSEGIPLYVEELVKATVKGIELTELKQNRVQSSQMLSTINDALMAQLDQLGSSKEVTQHASVIGYEFSPDLLSDIMKIPVDQLAPALSRLIESRVVVQDQAVPDRYHFRHALIRDISYSSLLRKNRRQIHLGVARELSRRAAESGGVTDDLIAQHYASGEAHLEAVRFWQRGANRAIARSAHEEALAMLQSALLQLENLRGAARSVLELDIVLAQAMALRAVRGYSAAEVEERLMRARELCSICADSRNRFNVEWGLFQWTIVKGDVDRARELAMELLEHAGRHPDQPLVDAYLANGMVSFNAGDFEAAVRFLETGVGLSRPETDQPHFMTHGQNPGLFCLSYLARSQCFLGYLDRARETVDRALAIAATRSRDAGHIYGHVNAIIHAARVYHLCGDLGAEKRLAEEAADISRRNRYAYYEALSACHLGWVAGAEGQPAEGIDRLVAGLAALRQTGTLLAVPGFNVLLAQLYARAGRFDEAEQTLRKAAGLNGYAVWSADVERVHGDIAASRENPDWTAAEAAYRSSLAIAQRQHADLLACKAGVSLAVLLERLGRRQEGHALLKTCLDRIHEGDDLPIVRNARMVMRQLANAP